MPTRYRSRFSSRQIPGDSAPPVTSRHAERLGRSPLHDVRQHARVDSRLSTDHKSRAREFRISTNEFLQLAAAAMIKPSGGARRDRTDDLLLAKQALSQLSYGPVLIGLPAVARGSLHRPPSPRLRRAAFSRCASEGWRANRSGVSREGWWAWEDLNFRPHAYQARALTN